MARASTRPATRRVARVAVPEGDGNGALGASGVTIRDVARTAGVSASTVSNLLNGRDSRMRPRTRARIQKVIDELGYRPSRVARQLRTGRAQVLGLVVPSVANPFWGSFALAVEAETLRHGQQVLLCNSERNPQRELAYVEELWASGVRTVILGSSLPVVDHLRPLIERGLRVVAFDREAQRGDPASLISISVDNAFGGALATRHLLELGHRRIGFISGAITTISRQNRLAGYRTVLRDAGVQFRRELVWSDPHESSGDVESAELGKQGMQALLRLANPPTGVVAINDMYAIGACAAIREAGLAVPQISVVGFDDIVLAGLFDPPLTTVRQPLAEMAKLVVDSLRTENAEKASSTVMSPTLVVRGSTAPCHSGRNGRHR